MKNIIKITILGFVGSFFLMSCLDKIDVPLRQETQKMVVEGLITNDPQFVSLKISQTTSFGNSNSVEPLKGAYVEVRSSTSEVVVFRPVPDDLGFYRPSNLQWAGKPGVSYNIFIALPDGRTFQSVAQKMPAAVVVENLDATFQEGSNPGFQASASFKDPVETENYYRWTASGFHLRLSTGVVVGFGGSRCCNRCWVLKRDNSINLFSDFLVNGNSVKNRPVYLSPFYTLGKHLIEVQQFTISKDAFLFWTRYKDQQQRTGSIFDPLPASLTGNVVNTANPQDVALGFFEVSGLSRKRIEANATTQSALANSFNNPLYIPEGDCILAYPFSVFATENPTGW
jgi:Domain of unknown function (DUF4249)